MGKDTANYRSAGLALFHRTGLHLYRTDLCHTPRQCGQCMVCLSLSGSIGGSFICMVATGSWTGHRPDAVCSRNNPQTAQTYPSSTGRRKLYPQQYAALRTMHTPFTFYRIRSYSHWYRQSLSSCRNIEPVRMATVTLVHGRHLHLRLHCMGLYRATMETAYLEHTDRRSRTFCPLPLAISRSICTLPYRKHCYRHFIPAVSTILMRPL